MKRLVLKFVARLFRYAGFWIAAGLAILAIGHYAATGGLATIIFVIGTCVLFVGYSGMLFDRSRRIYKHNRERGNKN